MNKSFFIIFVIFIASCSSNEVKKSNKQYSKETLDFFNKIEISNSRIKQIELNDPVQNRKDDIDPSEELKNIKIDPEINYSEPTKEIPDTTTQQNNTQGDRHQNKSSASQKSDNVTYTSNESLIEIQQHLAYYCMNAKTLNRFRGSVDACENHAKQVLASCLQNSKTASRATVNCVLKKL